MKRRGLNYLSDLVIGVVILVGILSACAITSEPSQSTPVPSIKPTFTPQLPLIHHHPPPNHLKVDTEVFDDVGCPPNEYGFRICESDSPLAAFGCDAIEHPSNLLGGLDPPYPIISCLVWPQNRNEATLLRDEKSYLYIQDNCFDPTYIRYVLFQDGQLRVIKTEVEFREIFAPIETSDEALSYALALTGWSANYVLKAADPRLRYFVDELEETHVTETAEGYRLRLYQKQICGCGPIPTLALDLLITRAGDFKENINRGKVFEDSRDEKDCI